MLGHPQILSAMPHDTDYEETVMYIRRITGSAAVLLLLGLLVSPARAQSVDPTIINFGPLDVGESSTEPFTVSNNLPVTITITTTSIEVTDDATNAFSVDLDGHALPFDILFNSFETFNVTFTPLEAGPVSAVLTIDGEYTVGPTTTTFSLTIDLFGEGVGGTTQMIDALIEDFEDWVDKGSLVGTIRGKSNKSKKSHYFVIRNMLLSVQLLINAGDYVEAYEQLESILKHVGGVPARPWVFVTGDSIGSFITAVEKLMGALKGP